MFLRIRSMSRPPLNLSHTNSNVHSKSGASGNGLNLEGFITYCFTQVNRRKRHLQYLLKSLSDASDIQNTLLIFSHDYFDEAINNVIKAIDFGPYIQIFYPLPIQLYPSEFPGDDPNDW